MGRRRRWCTQDGEVLALIWMVYIKNDGLSYLIEPAQLHVHLLNQMITARTSAYYTSIGWSILSSQRTSAARTSCKLRTMATMLERPATMDFIRPDSKMNRRYMAAGQEISTGKYEKKHVIVRDARPKAESLTLDTAGFQLLEHSSKVKLTSSILRYCAKMNLTRPDRSRTGPTWRS